jgi:hypothetical protein
MVFHEQLVQMEKFPAVGRECYYKTDVFRIEALWQVSYCYLVSDPPSSSDCVTTLTNLLASVLFG